MYKNNVPKIQKCFTDVKFGGYAESHAAAAAYVDEQVSLHNLPERLSWKNRSRKECRKIQRKHGRKYVKVGTGRAAARKAYDLGMSEVTCFKVSTGRQDFVVVNSGGWRTPEYEDYDFKHDISNAEYGEIRDAVNCYAVEFSEVEKSEMVSDIMIKISIGERTIKEENNGITKNIGSLVSKWVSIRRMRKRCPETKEISMDNEEISYKF